MTLPTNLKHVATAQELTDLINSKENVMVCAGRMGPMCIPVYDVMKTLEDSGDYDHVEFRDMLFDSPEAAIIRNLPECASFMGLPFTVYYKNGKVAKATTSIQNMDMVKTIVDAEFAQ
ncbi:MAG: thioredoxin [Bacteroidales bacterium]|nr:thioredoxin [Bacteroidales bacterium]